MKKLKGLIQMLWWMAKMDDYDNGWDLSVSWQYKFKKTLRRLWWLTKMPCDPEVYAWYERGYMRPLHSICWSVRDIWRERQYRLSVLRHEAKQQKEV